MKRCCLKTVSLMLLLLGLIAVQSTVANGQAYKEAVGYNALVLEKGGSLEDGTGIVVMQPEALSGGNYMPNAVSSEFSGKTLTDGTGTSSGSSSHASLVGFNFYGNNLSMSPGILDITGYDANDYLDNILNFDSGGDPLAQSFDVGNHSYITNGLTIADAENLLERFDFVINRDNTVMAVGANNGSGNSTPQLLAPSYNSITVGRSNGNHSQSLTSVYGAPRFAVEIVVPNVAATSFATPVVASAAALLRDAGGTSDFIQNEVIRASLFAGATKEEFASWDKTATRPLDEVFGYGELNILNSYNIFAGGETDASTSDPASNISPLGWDYGNFDGTNDLYYDFTIDPGEFGKVSAILSWNMEITDNGAPPHVFDASRNLADLNLDVFDSSGSFLGTLLDDFSSNGTDYNNEHIYQGLANGDYTFRVSGDSATDFGFAWRMQTFISGDSDLDGDVDTLDINTAAGNFTGNGGSSSKLWADGDFDGDGDVDTQDINTAAGNFTGALAGAPGVPDIWYDPLTGNITVDTDGANVGGLTLLSAGSNFTGADVPDFSDFGFLLNDPDSDSQIGGALGPGFMGVADLGNIAATGLTLDDFLGSVWASQPFGQVPAPEFFLGPFVGIPEPSAMLMLGMGLVGLAGRRRRSAA